MAKTSKKPVKIEDIAPTEETALATLDAAEIDKEDDVSPANLNFLQVVNETPKIPTIGDPAWSEYILSQFAEDELIDGHPTCDGLRRIFGIFMGIIVSSKIDVLQVPVPQHQNRATVQITIDYVPHVNPFQTKYTISDVADCFEGNTKFPYYQFPTATAATTAEGRALRKALRLKVITLEEAQSPDAQTSKSIAIMSADASPINDMQRNAIFRVSKNLNIDPAKLLVELSKDVNSKTSVESLNTLEAQAVLRQLTQYDRGPDNGGIMIPETILTA